MRERIRGEEGKGNKCMCGGVYVCTCTRRKHRNTHQIHVLMYTLLQVICKQ